MAGVGTEGVYRVSCGIGDNATCFIFSIESTGERFKDSQQLHEACRILVQTHGELASPFYNGDVCGLYIISGASRKTILTGLAAPLHLEDVVSDPQFLANVLPMLLSTFIKYSLAQEDWVMVRNGLFLHAEGLFHENTTRGFPGVHLDITCVAGATELNVVLSEAGQYRVCPLTLHGLLAGTCEQKQFEKHGKVDGDGLEANLCVVLPSLKSSKILEISATPPPKERQTGFESASDFVSYWRTMYGYNLPSTIDTYVTVRPIGSPSVFTYPICCLWNADIFPQSRRTAVDPHSLFIDAIQRLHVAGGGGHPLFQFVSTESVGTPVFMEGWRKVTIDGKTSYQPKPMPLPVPTVRPVSPPPMTFVSARSLSQPAADRGAMPPAGPASINGLPPRGFRFKQRSSETSDAAPEPVPPPPAVPKGKRATKKTAAKPKAKRAASTRTPAQETPPTRLPRRVFAPHPPAAPTEPTVVDTEPPAVPVNAPPPRPTPQAVALTIPAHHRRPTTTPVVHGRTRVQPGPALDISFGALDFPAPALHPRSAPSVEPHVEAAEQWPSDDDFQPPAKKARKRAKGKSKKTSKKGAASH